MPGDDRPQPDEGPQLPRDARSAGVAVGEVHVDRRAVGQRALQPALVARVGRREVTDADAVTAQPGHQLGGARPDRRRAQQPADQPADHQPAEQHQDHRVRRERVDGEPGEHERGRRARAPSRPAGSPPQVAADQERDERGVDHEHGGVLVVDHRVRDGAALGPPDGPRHGRGRRGGQRGDAGVERVPPLVTHQDDQDQDREQETADAGGHRGQRRQPARDVLQPVRDVVRQLGAAERKGPDRADHDDHDRQREDREQQVRRTADAYRLR